jgi:hypothetical protein
MPVISLVAFTDAAEFAAATDEPGNGLALLLGVGMVLARRDEDVPEAECEITSRVCIHTFRESNGWPTNVPEIPAAYPARTEFITDWAEHVSSAICVRCRCS